MAPLAGHRLLPADGALVRLRHGHAVCRLSQADSAGTPGPPARAGRLRGLRTAADGPRRQRWKDPAEHPAGQRRRPADLPAGRCRRTHACAGGARRPTAGGGRGQGAGFGPCFQRRSTDAVARAVRGRRLDPYPQPRSAPAAMAGADRGRAGPAALPVLADRRGGTRRQPPGACLELARRLVALALSAARRLVRRAVGEPGDRPVAAGDPGDRPRHPRRPAPLALPQALPQRLALALCGRFPALAPPRRPALRRAGAELDLQRADVDESVEPVRPRHAARPRGLPGR